MGYPVFWKCVMYKKESLYIKIGETVRESNPPEEKCASESVMKTATEGISTSISSLERLIYYARNGIRSLYISINLLLC